MADQDFNIKVVTTADTSGIRQTESALSDLQRRAAQIGPGAALAERDAAAKAAAATKASLSGADPFVGRLEHGFERIAIHAAGIGLVLGAINQIKELANEINKITDSLDKQGESLVQNSRELISQSKFAKDDADVLKIAEAAMKNIAAQHKTVEELQKKELTTSEKLEDEYYKAGLALQGVSAAIGPNRARLDAQLAEAQKNEEAAQRAGLGALRLANIKKEQESNQSLVETVKELTDKIKEQQNLRNNAKTIQDYEEAGKAAQEYKKQLGEIITLEASRVAKIQKQVGTGATDYLKTDEAFQKEQARREDEQFAKTQVARSEAAILRSGGGPRDDEERRRLAELDRETSPQTLAYELGQTRRQELVRNLAGLGDQERAQFLKDYPQQGEILRGRQAPTAGDVETHKLLQQLLDVWK